MFALIPLISGLLSSFLPEVVKLFREKGDKKHEITLLKLQMEAAKLDQHGRQEEIRLAGAQATEQAAYGLKTAALEASARPSGVRWVDGWNSAMRPFITTTATLLWAWRLFGWVVGYPIPQEVWTPEVEFTVQYVFAFWFGERIQRHASNGWKLR